jgi:nanoRNase/pAp phosphatase (c-di-AMP/oligoRNAs hydrolase)
LPPDTPIDIVIDHHPPRGPVNAEYVDLRSDFGATSTLLVEYFQQFDVAIEPTVATALLFGIRIDTDNFSREVSAADFEAASTLVSVADLDTLDRFETPSIDPETMETIATAITNRTMHGPALITGVGYISNRDALAQAADRLLNLDGVTTTLVHGINEQTVFVSARARGADVDLGEALRDAFGQIGSAGGHADMAGAQLELGMMGVNEDTESVPDVVDDVLSDRFLEVLEARWNRQVPSDFFPGPIEELTPTDRS